MATASEKRSVWAEIDLKALENNYKFVKKKAGAREIIPIVKANAYGHGLIPVSEFFVNKMGAKSLGVARINEGEALKKAGVKASIIILGGFVKEEAGGVIKNGLEPSVFSYGEAAALNREAKKKNKKIGVHVKINTGMNRLGIKPESAGKYISYLEKLKNIRIRSVYTHFADADLPGDKMTTKQAKMFDDIKGRPGKDYFAHAANSAAITRYPYALFDGVRPGIMLYGSFTEKFLKKKAPVKEVMSLKASVVNVVSLKKGDAVSYGGIYRAKRAEKIAIISAGYGDGLRRELSGKWKVVLNGKKCPLVGRVCMDLAAVRVSGPVKTGDTALVFGKWGKHRLPVEDMAGACDTISYEIMTGITERVPRVYK